MLQFSYTKEAWAALVKNPEDRSVSVKALIEKLGGRMLGFYYCFGEYDGVIILEGADDIAAMTGILAGITPGHLKATKTTVLLTVEDAMAAMGNAGELLFAAPKG
jgi:uncharacterized protein with GYD domain